MYKTFFFILFLLSSNVSYSQTEAIEFYSHLQNTIKADMSDADSLVLSQSSEECSSCSWLIKLFCKNDSCLVSFEPPLQGIRDPDFNYLFKYKTSKAIIIASLDSEKVFLASDSFKPNYPAFLTLTLKNREENFQIPFLAGLYYRLRYLKSFIIVSD